jgi:hypothetical protein
MGAAGKKGAHNKSAERNTGKEGTKTCWLEKDGAWSDGCWKEVQSDLIADDEISSYCWAEWASQLVYYKIFDPFDYLLD